MNAIVPAADFAAYTKALCGPMDDKLFFADRLPDDVTVFVDFGCADGALLWATMKARFGRPGYVDNLYLGYDHDVEMLRAADKRCNFDPAFRFYSDIEHLGRKLAVLHKEGRKSVLILSSVVHEVLAQGQHRDNDFEKFWDDVVRTLGCDYVVFRDMAVELGTETRPAPELWRHRLTDPQVGWETVCQLVDHLGENHQNPSRKDFLHFLLKAIHPSEDWEKERAENYLPYSATEYLNRMTVGSGYRLQHFEHSALPYLRDRWLKEFGVYVPDATHVKMILKKGR